jgi:hypothetical protein
MGFFLFSIIFVASVFFITVGLLGVFYVFRRTVILDQDYILDRDGVGFTDKQYLRKNITNYSFSNSLSISEGRTDSWHNTPQLILYNSGEELGRIVLSAFNNTSIEQITEYLKVR